MNNSKSISILIPTFVRQRITQHKRFVFQVHPNFPIGKTSFTPKTVKRHFAWQLGGDIR